jgi:hypothetical protein
MKSRVFIGVLVAVVSLFTAARWIPLILGMQPFPNPVPGWNLWFMSYAIPDFGIFFFATVTAVACYRNSPRTQTLALALASSMLTLLSYVNTYNALRGIALPSAALRHSTLVCALVVLAWGLKTFPGASAPRAQP